MKKLVLPDQTARERAATELDTNFAVEAGAGSGKTTLMAQRIVNLISDKRPPESIAAVTFTRKAAAELRERVQLELERQQLPAGVAMDVFIGTIHSFCARLLRERPIEAGLDPQFRELEEDESELLREQWWAGWLERLHLADDDLLREVRDVGVEPNDLRDAFQTFVRYPDVDFSAPDRALRDIAPLARTVGSFIDRGVTMLPKVEPEDGWDKLQLAILRLQFDRRSQDWTNPTEFFDSLALVPTKADLTQKRWVRSEANAKTEKADAKALAEEISEWGKSVGAAALTEWYEHRYAPISALLARGAEEFEQYRMSTARLSFEDLLLHAAKLLRENAGARKSLGERWRYVLVDEFQDTDPVQVEILFLLGSEPAKAKKGAEQKKWSEVELRPGALFTVGDPKQSIYRFRRADIQTYEEAKRAIERQGTVVQLTSNFRSLPAIAKLVNSHFGEPGNAFPAESTPFQAAFAPLQPVKTSADGLVERYTVTGARGSAKKSVVIEQDAASVASWVASEIGAGRLKPEDVLILTRNKAPLAEHARQLAARGIAVAVSGAEVAFEAELHELKLLLDLMCDPDNPVLVAALLEGLFFGVSPADLWAAKEQQIVFTVAVPPSVVALGDRAQRVHDGLARLHDWLLWYRAMPPDVFLSRIFDHTGLLAYTAASELGDVRAGLLIRLIEDVRAASLNLDGDPARNALSRLLGAELPDAALLPGRADAVRIMNVHKAKGLEGEVVILAAPTSAGTHEATVAIQRTGGRPQGGVVISLRNGFQSEIVAQPPGWDAMQAVEQQFADAEEERLRYVSATRARSRLVISEFVMEKAGGPERQANRQWSEFAGTMDQLGAQTLDMPIGEASGRPMLAATAQELAQRVKDVETARQTAAASTWVHQTVSRAAKTESREVRDFDDVSAMTRGAGTAWGRAVHRVLEAVGRADGAAPGDALLARIAEEEGVVARLADLRATIERVMGTGDWREYMATPVRHQEWPVAGWVVRNGKPTYLEGVIDAAYQDINGWHVLDWKTDAVPDDVWAARAVDYGHQIWMYADLLSRATGGSVTSKLVRV